MRTEVCALHCSASCHCTLCDSVTRLSQRGRTARALTTHRCCATNAMSAPCSPFTGAQSTSQQSCEGNARHIVVKAPSDQVAVPSANESSPVHKVPQIQQQSTLQVAQSQARVSPVVPQKEDGIYTHSPRCIRLQQTDAHKATHCESRLQRECSSG